jgi:hypothetical protein
VEIVNVAGADIALAEKRYARMVDGRRHERSPTEKIKSLIYLYNNQNQQLRLPAVEIAAAARRARLRRPDSPRDQRACVGGIDDIVDFDEAGCVVRSPILVKVFD